MTVWRWLLTDPARGAWNMAVDEAVLRGVEAGTSPPTVRIYGWNPPCISLGYAQKAEQELWTERVAEEGLDIVRRFTGGRAVLHWNEVTYSVIAPIEPLGWSHSLASTYAHIGEVLAMGFQTLGTGVELEKGDVTDRFVKGTANRPCFASTSRSELVLQGKKLAGSAQRRTATAFLQHGSLLLGTEHLRIADYMRLDPAHKLAYLEQLRGHSISLNEAGTEYTFAEVAKALEGAFHQALLGNIQPGALLESELDHIQTLLPKYLAP